MTKFKCFGFVLAFVALVPLLTGCAGSSFPTPTQISATAATIGSDLVSYTQTLANGVQKLASLANVTAPVIEAQASAWGLLPANSSQLAQFNKVVNAITNVGGSAGAVESLLTTLQTTGVIPAAVNSGGNYHYHGVIGDVVRWKGGSV